MRLVLTVAALALSWAASASADDWGEVAQISTTLGVQANRLCLGEGSRGDIGCPTYAPYVTSGGLIGIGTSSPGALVEISSTDTTPLIVRRDGSAGSVTMQFATPNGSWYAGARAGGAQWAVANTSNLSSGSKFAIGSTSSALDTSLFIGGNVVGGGSSPSTTLHVSGTIRIANGGETCNTDRAGAMRWHAEAGQFQVCYGSGGWALLSSAATSGSTVDRIVSGTSSIIASQDRSVTISTAATQRMVVGENGYVGIGTVAPDRLMHLVGAQGYQIALQQNGSASASTIGADSNSFLRVKGFNGLALVVSSTNQERMRIEASTGNVGIGTTSPSKTLTVNGDADVSGTVKVAGTGAESCTMGTLGQIRLNPTSGKFEVCRQ